METKGNALVLSGGGARGAFQAGAMKALIEVAAEAGDDQPFSVISGVSAGAINATYYAATCDDPLTGMNRLTDFWAELKSQHIYRSGFTSLGKTGARWAFDLVFGGLLKMSRIKSLLDTRPLQALLEEHLPIHHIERNLAAGLFDAIELTASNYGNSESTSFIQSNDPHEGWLRQKRRSIHTRLTIPHVMASAAIPLFFPPIKVGRDWFGDGCLRNPAPLSPAIRLGGRRLFIVGVRKEQTSLELATKHVNPTIARILSVILNAILLDSTEIDLERLARMNGVLNRVPANQHDGLGLQVVDYLFIRPTEDIGQLASQFVNKLPKALRYAIDGLGSSGEASELISYLLFDPEYNRYLVDLGYRDAMARKDEILTLLTAPRPGR